MGRACGVGMGCVEDVVEDCTGGIPEFGAGARAGPPPAVGW